MEHQVLVRLPVGLVRQALREPGVMARCVPGLTVSGPAAHGEPVAGRLRLRVAGTTITYRGEFVATWEGGEDGALSVIAKGHEARGEGAVSARLRIAVEESAADGLARLLVTGDVLTEGRLGELDPSSVGAAGQRMLERLATALAAGPAALEGSGGGGDDEAGPEGYGTGQLGDGEIDDGQIGDGETGDEAGDDEAADVARHVEGLDALDEELLGNGPDATGPFEDLGPLEGVDDVDVPGSAEQPDADAVDADLGALDSDRPLGGGLGEAAPADASGLVDGPVRRSIVGRSAEEVDHAPPRGRYAPALPARGARSARARAAVRWSAGAERRPATPVATPEADHRATWVIGGGVALIGGAVVLVRALRRR